MKMNFKKDENKELIIEFDTSDYTIPDIIANRLNKNSNVSFAGVYKDHPEIGKPTLVIKTERKKAKEVLKKVLKGIEEEYSDAKEKFAKKSK